MRNLNEKGICDLQRKIITSNHTIIITVYKVLLNFKFLMFLFGRRVIKPRTKSVHRGDLNFYR